MTDYVKLGKRNVPNEENEPSAKRSKCNDQEQTTRTKNVTRKKVGKTVAYLTERRQ